MLRKLAMVVVVVFLGPIGTGVQLMVCLGVVMAALVAQVGCRWGKGKRVGNRGARAGPARCAGGLGAG